MKLRPRYSLLTLLLITALIAGGVKLWYGPHHVVEPLSATAEVEFTYTRDLSGNRIVDGPVVHRDYMGRELTVFVLRFFRQGTDSKWTYCCYVPTEGIANQPKFVNTDALCPLSAQELKVYYQTRDKELQKLSAERIESRVHFEGEAWEGCFDKLP